MSTEKSYVNENLDSEEEKMESIDEFIEKINLL